MSDVVGRCDRCDWECGCTQYAKKRRLLRNHRTEMRIMQSIIGAHGLASELEEELLAETGNTGFPLGLDTETGGMDEDSDHDPEADLKQQVQELRQEAADQQSDQYRVIAAVLAELDSRSIATDLERARARMSLEDHRSLGIA
jgi:hypothetical protein